MSGKIKVFLLLSLLIISGLCLSSCFSAGKPGSEVQKPTATGTAAPAGPVVTKEKMPRAPMEAQKDMSMSSNTALPQSAGGKLVARPQGQAPGGDDGKEPEGTEGYDPVAENPFMRTDRNPISTFSIDVDTASYSNMRRFLNDNTMPPKDAVRIEEMINYFTYDYPQPRGDAPFSLSTEVSACPYNRDHKLVLIGLQGKKLALEKLPRSNLVFLLDTSGSMEAPNKLPLLKQSLKMLVNNLSQSDHISIVAYAGSAGVILPPTPGNDRNRILQALDNLRAGGSTAGGAGIKLAYDVAVQNFIQDGNNRVILATDGDFNVGISDDASLVQLIEEKRKKGVFLSILGFGMGNLKDSKMEKLADHGNGNYVY